jgi:hypothetical protein
MEQRILFAAQNSAPRGESLLGARETHPTPRCSVDGGGCDGDDGRDGDGDGGGA